jgi:Protein of unknown function (DUF3237)
MLHTRPLLALHVELDRSIDLDPQQDEVRRTVAVRGGRVTGGLEGRVLPNGSEVHASRADGVSEIAGCYLVELEDGARFELTARGVRVSGLDSRPPGIAAPMHAERGSYRMHMRFASDAPQYHYLNSLLAVGVGTHGRALITVDVYAVD